VTYISILNNGSGESLSCKYTKISILSVKMVWEEMINNYIGFQSYSITTIIWWKIQNRVS